MNTLALPFAFLVLLATGKLNAQINEQLAMREYEKDKTAEAVVLFDIGKSSFVHSYDGGFDVLFERTTRIKIFTKAGYRHAEVVIPFYQEGNIFEKVTDIKGVTLNLVDGKATRTELDPTKIYEEKVNNYWNRKKFALPDVKEGSVIEFSYKILSPYKFNLRDWNFQSSIPTILSEYEVRSIPFYTYTYIFQGASKFDKFESVEDKYEREHRKVRFRDMIYTFQMKDLPAFVDEEFITSRNDYIIKLDFQLSSYQNVGFNKVDIVTTWPKLCNDLLESSYGVFLKASEKAAKKIFDVSSVDDNNLQGKIEKIINSVKSAFSWDGGYSLYPGKTVKEFLSEKSGSATNINLFLVGALRAAGIEAVPVLISTRSHGKIKLDYPFAHFFNCTIASAIIGNSAILLDATDFNCPYNVIPVECINEKGLMVYKNSDQWVELKSSVSSVIQKTMEISITPAGDSLISKMDIRTTGYDAVNLRNEYGENKDAIRHHWKDNGLHITGDIGINNYSDLKVPFNISFTALTKLESFGDKIYISPFLNEPVSENPFKQSSRSYPIDMVYSKGRIFNSVFIVPENYSVESLPKSYNFSNDHIDIDYRVNEEKGRILIIGSYNLKSAVYDHRDYGKLKYYFNEIIRTFNQKISLIKKEGSNI